jgi:cysteine sulfinate desulfinase/cysteine desulfurase-like protein
MGVNAEGALGTIRLTLGRATTDTDIELASNALTTAWRATSK